MLIIKTCPAYKKEQRFTQIGNSVVKRADLSDGAFRLYAFLTSWLPTSRLNDSGIAKELGISSAVVTRRKKELKEKELLVIVQIAPTIYINYLGHNDMSANEVKKYWDNLEAAAKGEER